MADWGRIAAGVLTGGGSEVFRAVSGKDSIFGGLNEEDTPARWDQAPEYAESQAARKKWWDTLSEYTPENNYGSISPDWAKIWEDTQKKIHQSYWGSPTSGGAVGKVRASAARRNVSDSPALDMMIGRLGASEANDLSSLAVEQNKQRSGLTENARQNWLQNLASLSGYKPTAQYIPEEEGTNWLAEILGLGAKTAVTAGLGSMFGGLGGAASTVGSGVTQQSITSGYDPTWGGLYN